MKVCHIHFNFFDHLINIDKISFIHLPGVYDELTIAPSILSLTHALHGEEAEPRFELQISDSKAYVYSFLLVFNFCDIGLSFKNKNKNKFSQDFFLWQFFSTGTRGNMESGGREKGRTKKKVGAAVRAGAHLQEII